MSYKHYGPRTRKGRAGLVGTILFLAAVIIVAAVLLALALRRVQPDRVMPGVRIWGENAAGLDREQVLERLRTKGYGAEAGKVFTLSLPGEELTVGLEELGLAPDAEAEADRIMAWGHTGSRGRDALNWLLGRNGSADFPAEQEPVLKEKPLEELCARASQDLDREPVQTVVFADADGLGVTLGTAGGKVDRAALLETVKAALEQGRYTAEYTPEVIPPDPLDLDEFWKTFPASAP